jgi:hypothetical protein
MKMTYSVASKPERKACVFVLCYGNNAFLRASIEASCRLRLALRTVPGGDVLDPYL